MSLFFLFSIIINCLLIFSFYFFFLLYIIINNAYENYKQYLNSFKFFMFAIALTFNILAFLLKFLHLLFFYLIFFLKTSRIIPACFYLLILEDVFLYDCLS